MNWLSRGKALLAVPAYFYRMVVVPLAAYLPAPLAYGLACRRGDWRYHRDALQRERIMRTLEGVLGKQLSPMERARVTRDYFRLRCCEIVDAMRLGGKGRALARLVEIRGREHLEAALAGGKGVILCGAHLGLYGACGALLGIAGFPVTVVGRWPSRTDPTMPPAVRAHWRLIIERRIMRHLRWPAIEPEPGQMSSAVQIAAILRQNAVVTMFIDPPALSPDRTRTVAASLLGHQARLLPGSVTIAQLTGAPLLMVFLHRSADWRHQVLEISPPVPLDGDTAAAFNRCIALVDAAIRRDPAHWIYWSRPEDLIELGLLPTDFSRAVSSLCPDRQSLTERRA
jgi:lauroyl/myristoyl acyltransferase